MGIRLDRRKSTKFLFKALPILVSLLGICSGGSVPAMFIFGDSTVSVGNNFYRNVTAASPNIPPYGIDLGTKHPPGRYTNGRIIPDIIGQELGFVNFTPPYFAPITVGDVILKGVNYASGASGILHGAGFSIGNVTDMDRQISYFAKTKQAIISRIGRKAAENLIKRSLYYLSTGSNDVSLTDKRKNITSEMIISRFKVQLTRLYNLGARKIVVASALASGCMPIARNVNFPAHGCIDVLNLEAQLYNAKLKEMLEELNISNRNSTYVYADFYLMTEEIVQNYQFYGFQETQFPCCKSASILNGILPSCTNTSEICPDRSKYVFWDVFHLTEAANLIEAKHVMDGGLNYISPMNIRQLVNV